MSQPWLLVDVHNLCHRAFHAVGELSHNDLPTGVLYGVFRDLISFRERFQSNRYVFCFDYGESFRSNIYRDYKITRKKKRKEMKKEEALLYNSLLDQIRLLRTEYLPLLEYRNILFKDGFEADDVIGSVATNLQEDDTAVIISGDHDFYQLITSKVSVYHPRGERLVDKVAFRAQWKIKPKLWVKVKAMAGCSTDDIPGIDGIGEITAAKYLRGELSPESAAYKNIKRCLPLVAHNIDLVELPYRGCPKFELLKNKTTPELWTRTMDSLGMRSLRKAFK